MKFENNRPDQWQAQSFPSTVMPPGCWMLPSGTRTWPNGYHHTTTKHTKLAKKISKDQKNVYHLLVTSPHSRPRAL